MSITKIITSSLYGKFGRNIEACVDSNCPARIDFSAHDKPPVGWGTLSITRVGKKNVKHETRLVCPDHSLVFLDRQRDLFDDKEATKARVWRRQIMCLHANCDKSVPDILRKQGKIPVGWARIEFVRYGKTSGTSGQGLLCSKHDVDVAPTITRHA